MNTDRIDRTLSPRDYAALTDAAKRRAEELRREAASDFWRAVEHAVSQAMSALRKTRGTRQAKVQPCRP
jgi:hypothetical protein